MKEIGKSLCIAIVIMLGVELLLVYGLHPLLMNFGDYAILFTLIIIEAALYKTLLFVSFAMSVFYSMVLAECLFTKLMKRIGIEE